MKRHDSVVGIRPDMLEAYKAYHAKVWPAVLASSLWPVNSYGVGTVPTVVRIGTAAMLRCQIGNQR
jgi:hypothetical protein